MRIRIRKEHLGMCKSKRKKIEKFEQSIREITKHNRGVSADYLIAELNSCLCGWKLLRSIMESFPLTV